MAEVKGIVSRLCFLISVVISPLSASWIVYADECGDACSADPAGCSALRCHLLSVALGGCWFDGSVCRNCKGGDRDVHVCEDYSMESCGVNPCSLDSVCRWSKADVCISSGTTLLDCKAKGCRFSYRCMADGECVHYTTSVQEYCNTAYREYGFFYELDDTAACVKVGEVCKEVDKKCGLINTSTLDGKERKRECLILKSMCLQCQGDCELRRNIASIENVVYGITAGIAVVLLVVYGLQLASSEDALTRNNAKKSMMYVVIGLAVIALAVKAVEYIWVTFI